MGLLESTSDSGRGWGGRSANLSDCERNMTTSAFLVGVIRVRRYVAVVAGGVSCRRVRRGVTVWGDSWTLSVRAIGGGDIERTGGEEETGIEGVGDW